MAVRNARVDRVMLRAVETTGLQSTCQSAGRRTQELSCSLQLIWGPPGTRESTLAVAVLINAMVKARRQN